MNKPKAWDRLSTVGKDAPLKEAGKQSTTKAKSLRAVPTTYFEKHEELRKDGKTSLDFSAYIIEAIREKLERDSAL
ncbi:hypothetical protein [Vibrio furnissii]|uniref:hypothetical protein n=1 Tax=Vibrio furnissii TaxID=29494 RepID=UPI001EE9C730|nr:hypothetical protein [Vibrio furnissii]MCG6268279.1 hypothetical protein [Vibrio furnissii]